MSLLLASDDLIACDSELRGLAALKPKQFKAEQLEELFSFFDNVYEFGKHLEIPESLQLQLLEGLLQYAPWSNRSEPSLVEALGMALPGFVDHLNALSGTLLLFSLIGTK